MVDRGARRVPAVAAAQARDFRGGVCLLDRTVPELRSAQFGNGDGGARASEMR
jgi:hypothetical protein